MYANKAKKQTVSRIIERKKMQQSQCIDSSNKKLEYNKIFYHSNILSPIQCKTQIYKQDGRNYDYKEGTVITGKCVEVGLDPNDMWQGQSANLNHGQDKMMECIRGEWGIKGGDVVKGHLWNDNLGGSALNMNLYPITRAANKDHLAYAENKVKKEIYNKRPVYYKVEVESDYSINNPTSKFHCEIKRWNPTTGKKKEDLYPPVTIESDFSNVKKYDNVTNTQNSDTPIKINNLRKPNWIKKPKTKVSELTPEELSAREKDINQQTLPNQESTEEATLNMSSLTDFLTHIDDIINEGNPEPIDELMTFFFNEINTNGNIYNLIDLADLIINSDKFGRLSEIEADVIGYISEAINRIIEEEDIDYLMDMADLLISSGNLGLLPEEVQGNVITCIDIAINVAISKATEEADIDYLMDLADSLINSGNYQLLEGIKGNIIECLTSIKEVCNDEDGEVISNLLNKLGVGNQN